MCVPYFSGKASAIACPGLGRLALVRSQTGPIGSLIRQGKQLG